MFHHLLPRAGIIGAAVLILAACGSTYSTSTSGSSPSAASPSADSSAVGTPISVEAQDYMFAPAALKLPANTLVTVTIHNTGVKKHNFSIDDYSVNQNVPAGATMTVTFTTKSDASLAFYCSIHRVDHGMEGVATVGAGGTPAPVTSPTPKPAGTPYNPYG